ncbi:two-component system, NarL family, sensor kinase [Colwellia chukchiensis]|uniref:Two-component system, NarL family, sensor kinase n=1 Tax=Colwellia chukchiensis TaxID=641665 RepID=A0A1H7JAF9_9GAMM|nr:sensor histidine kinase [Colwellia chukchiensis]SEK71628.1 two-component system, NarL family, sensor kinase [Colwellia chukchiensis]
MTNNTDVAKLVAQLNEKQKQISQQLYFGNEQMRGLAKRVWRVQEDERKHIARELHDGVGQLLTALINQLQQVQKSEPKIALNESIDLARQALSDTRVISRLMRPRILDDLGLIPALEWLVRIMAEPEDVVIEFHQQVTADIDSDSQTLAFRVIQEALTNAIKHAQASTITLNLIATNKLLMIKIQDDGVGMAAGTAENPDGFGLGAMRDRVSAFGGQLTINSAPNQGCEIKVLVTGREGP